MTYPRIPSAQARYSPWRGLGYLMWCETLKVVRNPAFMVPILVLPLMLFAFFGWPNVGREFPDGQDIGTVFMVAYAAYSMMMVGLFSFGVTIAMERGYGWMTQLRATPMYPLSLFAAKVVMALVTGFLALCLLFSFGLLVGVKLGLITWMALLLRLLLGMIPFVLMGLWIGYAFAPNAAAGVANLILLPVSFASGLFVPLDQLPKFLQDLAPLLPAYHSGQLAFDAMGWGDGWGFGIHALWLLEYGLIFLLLTLWAYRSDEDKTYG